MASANDAPRQPHGYFLTTSGPYSERVFPVGQAGGLIGRSRKCCISLLHDCEVSHNHAVMDVQGGALYIRDVGSTFGTYLNDKRLSEPKRASDAYKLKPCDSIKVGQTSLRWRPIESIESAVAAFVPRALPYPSDQLEAQLATLQLPAELVGGARAALSMSITLQHKQHAEAFALLCRAATPVDLPQLHRRVQQLQHVQTHALAIGCELQAALTPLAVAAAAATAAARGRMPVPIAPPIVAAAAASGDAEHAGLSRLREVLREAGALRHECSQLQREQRDRVAELIATQRSCLLNLRASPLAHLLSSPSATPPAAADATTAALRAAAERAVPPPPVLPPRPVQQASGGAAALAHAQGGAAPYEQPAPPPLPAAAQELPAVRSLVAHLSRSVAALEASLDQSHLSAAWLAQLGHQLHLPQQLAPELGDLLAARRRLRATLEGQRAELRRLRDATAAAAAAPAAPPPVEEDDDADADDARAPGEKSKRGGGGGSSPGPSAEAAAALAQAREWQCKLRATQLEIRRREEQIGRVLRCGAAEVSLQLLPEIAAMPLELDEAAAADADAAAADADAAAADVAAAAAPRPVVVEATEGARGSPAPRRPTPSRRRPSQDGSLALFSLSLRSLSLYPAQRRLTPAQQPPLHFGAPFGAAAREEHLSTLGLLPPRTRRRLRETAAAFGARPPQRHRSVSAAAAAAPAAADAAAEAAAAAREAALEAALLIPSGGGGGGGGDGGGWDGGDESEDTEHEGGVDDDQIFGASADASPAEGVAGAALGRPAAEALCARLRRLQCRQAAGDAAALRLEKIGLCWLERAADAAAAAGGGAEGGGSAARWCVCLGSAARGVTLVEAISALPPSGTPSPSALRDGKDTAAPPSPVLSRLGAARALIGPTNLRRTAWSLCEAFGALHSVGLAFGGAVCARHLALLPGASVQLRGVAAAHAAVAAGGAPPPPPSWATAPADGWERACWPPEARAANDGDAAAAGGGDGGSVDPYAADVWSLGVLLLQLHSAGRPPPPELERGEGLPEAWPPPEWEGGGAPDAPMVALLRAMLGPAPALRPSVARLGLHPCWRGATDAPRRSSADARTAARRGSWPADDGDGRSSGRTTDDDDDAVAASPLRLGGGGGGGNAGVVALHDALWECAAEAAAAGRRCGCASPKGASPPTFSPLPPPPPPTNSSARCAAPSRRRRRSPSSAPPP